MNEFALCAKTNIKKKNHLFLYPNSWCNPKCIHNFEGYTYLGKSFRKNIINNKDFQMIILLGDYSFICVMV